MKNILVIGAGRSASSLIKYLLDNSSKENWNITVGDVAIDLVKQKTANHPNSRAIAFDITNDKQREEEIKRADLVISMLPASMHMNVARDCVRFKKHLATASYVSKEMIHWRLFSGDLYGLITIDSKLCFVMLSTTWLGILVAVYLSRSYFLQRNQSDFVPQK